METKKINKVKATWSNGSTKCWHYQIGDLAWDFSTACVVADRVASTEDVAEGARFYLATLNHFELTDQWVLEIWECSNKFVFDDRPTKKEEPNPKVADMDALDYGQKKFLLDMGINTYQDYLDDLSQRALDFLTGDATYMSPSYRQIVKTLGFKLEL